MLDIAPAPVYKNMSYIKPAGTSERKMSMLAFAGSIKNLEPQKVWGYFEEISKIYRESGHNEEISHYLVDKLNKSGFEVEQVQKGTGKYNIYASRNVDKVKKNAIILQAHMDMVGISDNKDPKKPIILNIDGDFLKANSRTLGADNGIGLAIALAISEDPKFKDLPLQIIFTIDEETGMYGASAMKAEDFKGHYLINIDSEKFGEVTIGCAGMDTYKENLAIPTIEAGKGDYKKVKMIVQGATGGHSGEDINKGRINPLREAISILNGAPEVKLISVMGGEKFNSIPREAEVEFLAPADKVKDIVNGLNNHFDSVSAKQKDADPNLRVNIEISPDLVPAETKVLEPAFQERFLRILGLELHSGMKTIYENGDTKTSQNLGIVELKDGNLHLQVSLRSSDSQEKQEIHNQTNKQLSELLGKKVEPADSSPIWQPNLKSKLTTLAAQTYKQLGEKNPRVYTCHGGLENSMFAEKGAKLDQISVGPDIYDPHTTQEKVSISSVKKFYDFMEQFLIKIKSDLLGK